MEATNDNKLETYAPFETVNPFIYNLLYNQQIIDLTFAQFLQRHENFNANQFSVPLFFWMSLNELKKDEWFKLTDDIIDLIGYKSSVSNVNNNRSALLKFLRRNFNEGINFQKFAVTAVIAKPGNGCNKL